jgi:hypothetical protein
MRQILKVSMIVATLCGAVTVPPILAQTPIFVLPSLDPTPASAPSRPATTPPPARALVSSPANTALPAPATSRPAALPIAQPASDTLTAPATPRHHAQPEVTSEFNTCRKRYADAVYNIGLALWTAPPPQHRALERLLNAAAAAQAVAMDPNTTAQGRTFCADSTLNDLEATVVRLKAKGWVPMTETEQHATRTNNVGDELKHAIDAISR